MKKEVERLLNATMTPSPIQLSEQQFQIEEGSDIEIFFIPSSNELSLEKNDEFFFFPL